MAHRIKYKRDFSQESSFNSNFNDSESSLTEPLATFSDPDVGEENSIDIQGSYFDVQNKDLSLKIDSKTGRFVYSELKKYYKGKGWNSSV